GLADALRGTLIDTRRRRELAQGFSVRFFGEGLQDVQRPGYGLQQQAVVDRMEAVFDAHGSFLLNGPAPARCVDASYLRVGQADRLAIQRVRHFDLAAQATVRAALADGRVEHFVFQVGYGRQFIQPGLVYINVAGGTGQRAAAFAQDSF